MKTLAALFLAGLQGILAAAICWVVFNTLVDEYRRFENMDIDTLTMQLADQKTKDGKPVYASPEAAHAEAVKNITTAQKIKSISSLKISFYEGCLIACLGASGFVLWLLHFGLAHVFSKPSDGADDSIIQKISRFYIPATLGATIVSAILAYYLSEWTILRL
jgi:hypothetical protein